MRGEVGGTGLISGLRSHLAGPGAQITYLPRTLEIAVGNRPPLRPDLAAGLPARHIPLRSSNEMTLRYYTPLIRDAPLALGVGDGVDDPLDRFVYAPDRDGVPLPALTVSDLIGQLTYRTLGPKYGKARIFVEFVRSGESIRSTCIRHHIDHRSLRLWERKVRDAGVRQPLTRRIWLELSQAADNDNTTVRVRDLLGWREVDPIRPDGDST